MIHLFQIFLFLILTFVLPVIMGVPYAANFKYDKMSKLLYAYAAGFFEMLAIFEILQTVDLMLGKSLKLLVVSFLILVFVGCGLRLVFCMDEITSFFYEKKISAQKKASVECYIVGGLFLILVLAQIFLLVWFRDVQFGDNYFHTSAITDAVETGIIWRVEPSTGLADNPLYLRHQLGGWDMYLAYLTYVVQVHPMVMAYTLEPIFAVTLVYAVIYSLGVSFFRGNKMKTNYFAFIMAVLMLVGQYNFVSANGYFMNLPWAGRGMLYAPMVFWVFFLTYEEFVNRGEKKMSIGNEATWMLFLANVASVSMSFMSFQIILPMEVFLYFIYVIKNRRIFSFWKMVIIVLPQLFAAAVWVMEEI